MEYCGAGSVTDLLKSSRGRSLKEDWISYISKGVLKGIKIRNRDHNLIVRFVKNHEKSWESLKIAKNRDFESF